MQIIAKFTVYNVIYHAMPLNTAATLENCGHNYKFIMTVSGTVVPRMTGMLMAFIDQFDMFRGQGFGEPEPDLFGETHVFNGAPLGMTLKYSYNYSSKTQSETL